MPNTHFQERDRGDALKSWLQECGKGLLICFTALSLLFFTVMHSVVTPTLSASEPPELRIGVIASLSGNWAAFGDMTVKGLELARQELEKDGDIRIIFEVEDSQEHSAGTGAVTAYRALRTKGLEFFVGPSGTPGGLGLAPIVVKDPVIVISPSVAIEAFHLSGNNIFNSQGAFEVSSRLLANRAYADGSRKVAVFSSQQPYESAQADAFGKEFVRLGGEIVQREDPLPDQRDLRTEALRIVRSKPDAIFFSGYNQLALSSKEIKRLGFSGSRYTPLMDRSRFDGADGSLDGMIFARLGEMTPHFVETFTRQFGREPDYPADFAYDGLISLVRAVQQSQSMDVKEVNDALLGVEFKGALGFFEFDTKGCVIRTPTLWRIDGDTFKLLDG